MGTNNFFPFNEFENLFEEIQRYLFPTHYWDIRIEKEFFVPPTIKNQRKLPKRITQEDVEKMREFLKSFNGDFKGLFKDN